MSDARALLAWYDRQKRVLPWRTMPADPYRVWISEIMLQQTRVETVTGYYSRFLDRFPTVRSLADAELDEVLALWSGLGYYARARNLHRAAREIRDRHGGVFPAQPEAVRALPGIGEYTAGAILSIAFGHRAAVVDGNVVRVLSRVRALPSHSKDPRLKDACWEIARALVPAARPGDFNQALMELGATVCTPSSPDCGTCPLARGCEARRLERPEDFPAKAPRAKRPHRRVDCALVSREGRILVVRRPEEGLLGGLWELPSAPRKGRDRRELARALARLGLAAEPGERLATVEHAFTHFDMTLEAFVCEASGDLRGDSQARWVAREELADYGMSAAMRRVLTRAQSRSGTASAPRGRRACGRRRPRLPAPPPRSRSPSRSGRR